MVETFRASMKLRRIARQLKRWRDESGCKGAEVAGQLGWSTAKLSKYENAAQPISPVEVLALGIVYQIHETERDQLFHAATAAQAKGWWENYPESALVEAAQDYLELETEAAVEHTFKIDLIPGLLQTEAYATALARADLPPADDDTIRDRARTRLTRQALLNGEDPLQLEAVVGEAAIRSAVGGTAVHHEQLRRLLDLARQPNITIQVVPFNRGAYSAMGSPFDLLTFEEEHLDDVVYLENVRFGRLLEDADSVEAYRMHFADLKEIALSPQRSRTLIRDLIGGLQP